MPTGFLLLVALLTAIFALWIRRAARGCVGEGAATLQVASIAAFGFLTTEQATRWIGQPLHSLTGEWNYEDCIGHWFAIVCASTAVYMCLIRLTDDLETIRAFYTRRVILPLTLVVPLMLGAFELSHADETPIARLENLQPDKWLAIYWSLFCGTLIYLLCLAAWMVVRLRQVGCTLANLYLGTFGLTIAFLATLWFHVLTVFDIDTVVLTLRYAAAVMWMASPAYSWWLKSRPINIPDSMPLVDQE